MSWMRIALVAVLTLCPTFFAGTALAGKGLSNCWTVGDYPAAQSPELLERALALKRAENVEALTELRTAGSVIIPHAAKADKVVCGPDPEVCRATLFGKTWYLSRQALQCN